jgi:lipopolysaccharide transport system permease protein
MRPLPEVWVYRRPNGVRIGPAKSATARGPLAAPPTHNWLHVLAVMAHSDFRARYRAQALGVVWSLLNPLVMMSILSVIFTRVFRSEVKHFPVFMLIGLVLWQWVQTSLNGGTTVLVNNADMIKRTVFPRQLLPMSVVLSYGINFCVESTIVIASALVWPDAFRVSWALLMVPVTLAILALLLTGVSMATSVLNVIYRDVAYLVSTTLMLLYWLAPIVYPFEIVSERYRRILVFNPFAAILIGLRDAVMHGAWPSRMIWAGMLLPTAIIVLAGWAIFRHYERVALDYV